MGSRRTVIVAVALVLAAMAAFATYQHLQGLEERAFEDARLVKVFRVTRDIPKGLSGDDALRGYVAASRIPQKFRPGTALVDVNEIRGKVALTKLAANTVLVEGQFVDPREARVTFSQRIPAGMVAITVSVDQVRGVAGLLVPGDRVNILVGDGGSQRFLYQKVEVINIGTEPEPEQGEEEVDRQARTGSGLITFAVPPLAAQRIAYAAQQGGGLYLTLVPPDYQPVPVPPVSAGNLFGGGLTPYEG